MNRYKVLKKFFGQDVGSIVELAEDEAKGFVTDGTLELSTEDPEGEEKQESESHEKLMKGIKSVVEVTVDTAMKKIDAGLTIPDGSKVLVVRDNLYDADNRWGYKNIGDFARDIRMKDTGGGVSDRLEKYFNKANTESKAASGQNEAIGEDGAVLIAPEFSNQLIARAAPNGTSLLSLAAGAGNVSNLVGNTMTFLGLKDADRSVAGQRSAGVQAYWTDEAGATTASRAKFREISLKLKKLSALVYATEEMLEDSGNTLEQVLVNKAGDDIRFKVEEAIYGGNGVARPEGITNSAAIVELAKESSQAADTVLPANFAKLLVNIPAAMRSSAVFLVSPSVEAALHGLTVGNMPVYLPPGGLSGAPLGSLFGRPVLPFEHCPVIGDAGDVMCVSMAGYAIVLKGAIKQAVSIHLRFTQGETAFRFTYRIDGRSLWEASGKTAGSHVVSPFGRIAARA